MTENTVFLFLYAVLFFAYLKRSDGLARKVPLKVVVTGAHTPTGYSVFKKLLQRHKKFFPVGLVPTQEDVKKLQSLNILPEQAKVCDIRQKSTLQGIFDSAQKVIICSGSTPKQKWTYQIRSFANRLLGKPIPSPAMSDLYFESGKSPYEMDFLGQKNLFDSCLEAQVDHIVLLSRMGGKYNIILFPTHLLFSL